VQPLSGTQPERRRRSRAVNATPTSRLLAAIHDPAAMQAVLAALGLSGEVPELAPARAPPDEDWMTS
jgi:hypothetical protein